jgi:hypothetical protein
MLGGSAVQEFGIAGLALIEPRWRAINAVAVRRFNAERRFGKDSVL